jgi:hypothetical protein
MSRSAAASCFICFSLLLSQFALAGDSNRFRPVQNYNAGSNAAGPVVVADVNGDGKPDLLVGNIGDSSSEGSIGVLLGNGDGTFQPVTTYPTGGHDVSSFVVADVDGDAHPDLLVGQDDGVAVLFGNGDGTFRAPVKYLVDGGVTGVALADVNGDGKADLVVAVVRAEAGVLLGNGDGTFGPVTIIHAFNLNPRSIVVADVNHDGKPDILTYNFSIPGTLIVLLGDGTGAFQVDWTDLYDGGGVTNSEGALAVADVNGDGNLDVIVANDCLNIDCPYGDFGVLLGKGDGHFQHVKRFSGTGGWRGDAIAIADINRDGIPDLLIANPCNNEISCDHRTVGLLLGKGDGTFFPATSYSSGGAPASADRIAVMDVNGDGTADVFVTAGLGTTGGAGTVSVLLSLFDTTTNLTSSRSQSIYGQPVTLKATVQSNGPVAPTGTVLFLNGKASLPIATINKSVATLTTSLLPVGTLSLTATYRGDELSARSTSTAVSHIVTKATTVTAIQSSLNPSVQGQLVKFTATVTSPTAKPTGTVTFMAGTTTLGTVALGGGKATLTTGTLPHGQTKITAVYAGTANISGSSASLTQTVN